MSDFVSTHITATLTKYDKLVREGLRVGDVVEKVKAELGAIKKFYSECVALTAPEHVAAFKESYFLHKFIGDFQRNKDTTTFLAEQQQKLAKYDAKRARPPTKNDLAAVVAPLPLPRPRTPTPPRITEPSKVRMVSPVRPAIAGPGPRTIAKQHEIRRPLHETSFRPGKVRMPLPATTFAPSKVQVQQTLGEYRGFRDIDESGSESEIAEVSPPVRPRPVVLMEKTVAKKEKSKETEEKAKEKEKQNKRRDEKTEKGTVVRVKRRLPPRKSDADAVDNSDSHETSSEDEESQPYKATVKQEKNTRTIIATGKLYDPPCLRCRLAGKDCERQELGSACVACRTSKNRCEYSQTKKKVEKSKAIVVESDDDEMVVGRQNPTRRAAKAANEAIDEIVGGKIAKAAKTVPKPSTTPKPSSVARQPAKNKGRSNATKMSTAAQMTDLLGRVDNLTNMVEKISDFLGVDRPILVNTADQTTVKKYLDKYVQTEDPQSRPPSLPPVPSRPPTSLPAPMEVTAPPPRPSTAVPASTPIPPHLPDSVDVPSVNVVKATPLNSQEVATEAQNELKLTPPPSTATPSSPIQSSVDASVLPATEAPVDAPSTTPATSEMQVDASPPHSDSANSPAASVDHAASADHQSPLPTALDETATDGLLSGQPSSRNRTPRPVATDRLAVPVVSPRRTRSRTRSRSPTPLGKKRKADKDSVTKPNSKKRRT